MSGGVLPDWEILRRCREDQMITPFVEELVSHDDRGRVISYGPSSYGYDIRISDEFRIFHNAYPGVIDPKNFRQEAMIPFKGDVCQIPPNSFVLGVTVERFKIPRDITTLVQTKSTYARCGVSLTVTPFEAG